MEINIEISIKADLLEKIPNHIVSKSVESVLNQLQKAYVSALPKDLSTTLSSMEKMQPGIHIFSEKLDLEFSRSNLYEDNENELTDRCVLSN